MCELRLFYGCGAMAYIGLEHQLKTPGLKHNTTCRVSFLPLELAEIDPPPALDGRVIMLLWRNRHHHGNWETTYLKTRNGFTTGWWPIALLSENRIET